MKNILILLIGILSISCNPSKKESSTIILTDKSDNFDWLLGEWERLNEEEGKNTYENWEKISEVEYSGIGFTMQGVDTIKQEKIALIKASEKWILTVKVPEEKESVVFKMTNHTENEFTCENNEIDFPNKIRYWKSGNRMKASVSNAEMEIPFEFEKLGKQ